MFKVAPIVAVALGAVAVLATASPASAATLPPSDTLYALSCETGPAAGPTDFSALYTLNPDTAVATLAGAASTGITGDCAGPAAFDPTTGRSYYISATATSTLALIDATTGVATSISGFTGGSTNPHSIAIGTDGKAYAIWQNVLYSLNLQTGALAQVGDFMTDNCLYAFSVDPSTGLFYAIQCNTGAVYRVDVTTAALTSIGQIVGADPDDDGEQDIFALQIDTAGRWWLEAVDYAGGDPYSRLFSTAVPSGTTTPELEGSIEVNTFSLNTPSLLITYTDVPPPTPPLPATGSALPIGPLLGALGLVLVGGVVVLRVARKSRRA